MIDSVTKDEVSIEKYYARKENCIQDIRIARSVMTNKNSSLRQWEGAEKGLSFMLLYCPEEMYSLVDATINEMGTRKMYMFFSGCSLVSDMMCLK